MSIITCELPATGKGESLVKLANGKTTEVRRIYLVRGVTVTEQSAMVLLGCLMLYYLTSNGSRVGDSVVFVRK